MLGAWLVATLVAFWLPSEGVVLELPGAEGDRGAAVHPRGRRHPDRRNRAPQSRPRAAATRRATSRAATALAGARSGLWLYGVAALAVGQALIPGENSMHLHGSVVGGEPGFDAATLAAWALYNFVALAVVPFLYFHRRRRYSLAALNLRSADRERDALLILGVLSVESLLQVLADLHLGADALEGARPGHARGHRRAPHTLSPRARLRHVIS
jgi:hypothetical protein